MDETPKALEMLETFGAVELEHDTIPPPGFMEHENGRNVLEDGEDVTEISDRDLVLRAVNVSLEALAAVRRIDTLGKRVEALEARIENLIEMTLKILAKLG